MVALVIFEAISPNLLILPFSKHAFLILFHKPSPLTVFSIVSVSQEETLHFYRKLVAILYEMDE